MAHDYSKFRDQLKDEYNRGQSGGNELILKDRATVRVLTYLDESGRERMMREAPIHFGLRKQPVYCTNSTHDYCPACEAVKDAAATGDPDEIKWAESVQARRRYLFNVVNMDYPPEQRKVQILSATHSLKQAILSIYTDPAYERAIYVEGRDIILTRTGTGLNTEYNAKIRIDASDFDPNLANEVFDLDAYGDSTPDLIRDLLGGRAPADPEDPPPPAPEPVRAAAPTRRPPPPAKARAAAAAAPADAPVNPETEDAFPAEVDPVTGEPLDTRPAPAPARRTAPPPARQPAPAPTQARGGGRVAPQAARPRR